MIEDNSFFHLASSERFLTSGPIHSVNIPSFPSTEPNTEFDSINENLDRLSGYLEVERRLRNDSAPPSDEFDERNELNDSQPASESVVFALEPDALESSTARISSDLRLAFQILTLCLLGMVAAVIVSFDAGWRGPLGAIINTIPGKDKAVHFLVFGGLVVPTSLAFGLRTINFGSWRIFYGTLLMFVMSTAEEFSQLCFESRTFDLLDLTANYLGIAFFTGVVVLAPQVLPAQTNLEKCATGAKKSTSVHRCSD